MKVSVRAFAFLIAAYYVLAAASQAQTVASLTLSPSSIAGGRGGSSRGTVTLTSAAPAGGPVVSLSSSNTALAASVPSVTVTAGAAPATFTVATNALYRH